MVDYKVMLDTCNTNAIAINKLCKFIYRYLTMYLDVSQQLGHQGIYMEFSKVMKL